jgi:drug/metabolite transporter (DMT)-like permease
MPAGLLLSLLSSVLCAAAGQILLRLGAANRTDLLAFLNPWLFGGLFLYGLSTMLWVFVLSKLSLTVVYPFTALTIAVVYLAAIFFLGETMNAGKMLGIALIMAGLGAIWASAR